MTTPVESIRTQIAICHSRHGAHNAGIDIAAAGGKPYPNNVVIINAG